MSFAGRPVPGSVDDPALRLAIEALDTLSSMAPIAHPLVIGDASGRVAAALAARDAEPAVWLREVPPAGREGASPWPEAGPCDSALLRMPKSKAALDMALHAAAGLVPPDGLLAIFGANAEGIRSASGRLEAVAVGVETVRIGHHARVVAGRRRRDIPGHRASLDDWRETSPLEIAGQRRPWQSYPGTFAKGGLDPGTALLLGCLPPLADAARILDFAAGTGVIAAALLARATAARVTMLEADAVALAAAAKNVPDATPLLAASLAAAGQTRFDLIVSNPPIHEGAAESHRVLESLVAEAPRHLAPEGALVLVVQRRVPLLRLLDPERWRSEVLADDGRYWVVKAAPLVAPRPESGPPPKKPEKRRA